MAGELIINFPGAGETVRFPGIDSPALQAARVDRFVAHAQANGQPELLRWVPEWITRLDNAQDMLTTALDLGRPLFRRAPFWLRAPLGLALDINDALNTATNVLGVLGGGRIPKLNYYQEQTPRVVRRRSMMERNSDWLAAGLSKVGFLLQGLQVTNDLFGVGLALGSVMSYFTDTFWAGIRYIGTGRRAVIVMPPKDDLAWKALRVIQAGASFLPYTSWLQSDDVVMLAVAHTVAFDVLMDPPAVPEAAIDAGDIGYRRIHYDRYRDVVEDAFIQTASPYVDGLTEFPMALPMTADEMTASYGVLPVQWPWNPMSDQTLDASPYRELHLEAVARYAAEVQENRIADIYRSAFWSGDWGRTLFGMPLSDETKVGVLQDYRGAITEFGAWQNGRQELFRDLYEWEEKLLARAIEDNVFPGMPYNSLNYCHACEPFDSPVYVGPGGDAVQLVHQWLGRARFLWTNPGAAFWFPQTNGPNPVTWEQRAFHRFGSPSALLAASYEMWGAHYSRPAPDAWFAPVWANWQMGVEPVGIVYPVVGQAQRSDFNFKQTPSNDPMGCEKYAPAVPHPCIWHMNPSGTWTYEPPCPPPGVIIMPRTS